MYIFKNAMKNISRSKGRNILIGIIALVIGISSCVSISIRQSAKAAEKEGMNSISISATIGVNRQKLMEAAQQNGFDMREVLQQSGNLPLDELQKYSTSSYVLDFNYTLTSSVSKTESFEPMDTTGSSRDNQDRSNSQNNSGGNRITIGGGFPGIGNQGDFTITGYNSEKAMTNFINGTNKIIDGEMFSENTWEMECVISDQLATLNSIIIGDDIEIANPNLDTETYKLKVVGIYSTVSGSNDSFRFSTSMDPANQIYTSYNALNTVALLSSENAETGQDSNGNETTTAIRTQVSGTYLFANPSDYESFEQDVRSMGLSEYYAVNSPDVNSYEDSLIPLKNISNFATTMLFIVLIIGGIILVILNIFNIRERKYEIGVLTAIGMRKSKVALQYISELFIVTLVAIIIGTGVGATISVPIANSLLEAQVSAQVKQTTEQNRNFGRPGQAISSGGRLGQMQQGGMIIFGGIRQGANINYIDRINAVTDLTVILKLMSIGMLLTFTSSCAAVVFILRYEPLEILSNRV